MKRKQKNTFVVPKARNAVAVQAHFRKAGHHDSSAAEWGDDDAISEGMQELSELREELGTDQEPIPSSHASPCVDQGESPAVQYGHARDETQPHTPDTTAIGASVSRLTDDQS